jgi:hypothetical protein
MKSKHATRSAQGPKKASAGESRLKRNLPKTYKGRPLITREDRKQMKPNLPPETGWYEEMFGE